MLKLVAIVLIISVANANRFSLSLTELAKSYFDQDEKMGLTQLITTAMGKTDPREIIVPGVNSTGIHLETFPF